MYAVVNIHPETLHICHRSFHQTHQEAVVALKEGVTDYITNYKKYQTVIYINNKAEINNHKDTKYFLKVSNKYPNRISIYERRQTINKGYLYNSTQTHVDKIKVFYVTEISIPNMQQQKNEVQNTVTDLNWVNQIQHKSREANISHAIRVNMIEELKKQLQDRREKCKFE